MKQEIADQIPIFRIRPRFQVETDQTVEQLADKLKTALSSENAVCFGHVNLHFGTLYIPNKDQHYWSPQLSLSFEKTETGTIVRGFYSPKPAIWTMFIFFYTIIGIAILFISIFGLSYRSLGDSGAILWLVPVLIIIFLSLYAVAFTGQRLGQSQMLILHHFIEKSTGLKINP